MQTDYYSDRRLSNSKLTCLAQDPRKFKALYVDNPPTWTQPDNDAFVFGHAVHCLALEPERFEERFAVAPSIDRRTKQGKLDWLMFNEHNKGKELLDDQTYEDALACVQALNNHAEYAAIMAQPRRIEHEIKFDFCGHPFKAKLDCVVDSMRLILDIKTTDSCHPDKWKWSAIDYGYHRQASLYRHAMVRETGAEYRFIFAVVEKPTPSIRGLEPTVALYEIDADAMYQAGNQLNRLMDEYNYRMETNDWKQPYSKGIVSLQLPQKKVYSEVF